MSETPESIETETPEQNDSTEERSVQSYRHSAKRSLKNAQQSLALRTDATREVYVLVNGMVETVIQGRPGFSQREQVRRLTEAHDTLVSNMEDLPEKVAAAKASITEQMDAWETTILSKAQEAVDTLAEAKVFAAERDFAAWQDRKGRPVGTYEQGKSESEAVDTGYDEEDDDE